MDPATHTDDHIPYSDTTLKLFREDPTWAQTQEREFRLFASAPEEKRLRFKPMPSNKRAFLHSLAEDFGFDSESEDPEPHRHVCIFKTPRFVSAPYKTLAQCMRIIKANAAISAASARQQHVAERQAQSQRQQAFNALLLRDARFGLTIDELERAIANDLATAARSGPALKYTTSFLPSEEILIRAAPVSTAAAVATSLPATPQSIETTLTTLKPLLAKTISRLGLARSVSLCHADTSLNITRREGDKAAGSGGWSAVASRGSWRRAQNAPGSGSETGTAAPVPRSFVALRKLEPKKKEKKEAVEEDWLEAAEKLEKDGGGEDDIVAEGGGNLAVGKGNGIPVAGEGCDGATGEKNRDGDAVGTIGAA